MKTASKIYTALIMIFLFAPIAILLVFSFNVSKSLSVFSGFSLNWYRELFKDTETLRSVRNTLILALSASLISTVMGTAAAVGIDRLRSKLLRASLDTVTNIPMINPDIITGISLMLMFVFVGRLFGAATSLNFTTMLIAHITADGPFTARSSNGFRLYTDTCFLQSNAAGNFSRYHDWSADGFYALPR